MSVEQLQYEIAAKFASVSTGDLIRKMNNAADLGYDDEAIELSRRLHARGVDWRWAPGGLGPQHVEVFDPTSGNPIPGF